MIIQIGILLLYISPRACDKQLSTHKNKEKNTLIHSFNMHLNISAK